MLSRILAKFFCQLIFGNKNSADIQLSRIFFGGYGEFSAA